MFCPVCGLENHQSNQFCRACGTDLRLVKSAMSKPDAVTISAVTAREEIGRAFADKIRAMKSADDLSHITEEVLPEIEKFLESPEERRLRRLRTGSMLSFIGLGAAIAAALISFFSSKSDEFFLIAGLGGIVTLFIGLAILINGIFFTLPAEKLESSRPEDAEKYSPPNGLNADTNELVLPEGNPDGYISVTDATTRHLRNKEKLGG